jgi:ribosomal-protein-alanine N-acetyltransferase
VRVRIEAMVEADVEAVVAIDPSAANVAQLREELVRPWARIWVAREEGAEVLAFVLVWHVADELHLLNIATRADRRRGGLGRALLAHTLAYARSNGVRSVFLEVRPSNAAAIALYRGAGFTDLGVRARYYPDGEDALEMILLAGEEPTRSVE